MKLLTVISHLEFEVPCRAGVIVLHQVGVDHKEFFTLIATLSDGPRGCRMMSGVKLWGCPEQQAAVSQDKVIPPLKKPFNHNSVLTLGDTRDSRIKRSSSHHSKIIQKMLNSQPLPVWSSVMNFPSSFKDYLSIALHLRLLIGHGWQKRL